MYAGGSKKLLPMLILEILKEHTDEQHRLTQQEIIDKLWTQYGVKCDRRSVHNNLESLKDMGYDIFTSRKCYLAERDFDDAELRMLIDSVLFSKNLSKAQSKRLIEKLTGLGNKYFKDNIPHVSNLPALFHSDNKQVMITLNTLNDAIKAEKKVRFIYNTYGTDFELHPKREESYIVSPYQMVENNGRYYLIGNYDKYNNVAHIRVDKMTDVKILDEKAKPMKDIPELKDGLNLPKHMAEHMYMFSGESIPVKLETTEDMMQQLVDWFGNDFRVEKVGDGKIRARVTCNAKAMRFWALQYGPYVEVLEPKKIREELAKDIKAMAEKYK